VSARVGRRDEAHAFTFAELWALAMDDPDFAAGRIDAEEFFRRLTDPRRPVVVVWPDGRETA
jgi:hypothetical protein